MHILVRCCGERTERKCIETAKKQGEVHIIKTQPFGKCLQEAYKLALKLNQKWIPMIDGDVLILPGVLTKAINYLNAQRNSNIFCLDGKTKDKIFMCTRRAGIHIYKTSLLSKAIKYINSSELKPESTVRRTMTKQGKITVVGPIVFGYHDYEQYYADLWRKAFTQTQKLARKIRRSNIRNKWKAKSVQDQDFKVILAAHDQGRLYKDKIMIDKRINYGSTEGLKKLGIVEKGEL